MNIERFATARLGVFRPDGRFEELPDDVTEARKDPQYFESRWVGGHNDMQLLRALMAEATSPITLRKLSPEEEANLIDSLKNLAHGPLVFVPHEPGVYEAALRRVLDVVQRYLVPMGLSKHDALSEIIAIVDPWPTGASQQAAPEPAKYDDVLIPFVAMMRKELHANSGKGDRPGWLSMTREVAMLEIWHHAAKLQKAALNDDTAAIQEHAADVANMSMMLLDVCGGLAAPQAAPAGVHVEAAPLVDQAERPTKLPDAADGDQK